MEGLQQKNFLSNGSAWLGEGEEMPLEEKDKGSPLRSDSQNNDGLITGCRRRRTTLALRSIQAAIINTCLGVTGVTGVTDLSCQRHAAMWDEAGEPQETWTHEVLGFRISIVCVADHQTDQQGV